MDIQRQWKGTDSIDLDENRDNWWAVVNTVMNRAVGCNTHGSVWSCGGIFSCHFFRLCKGTAKKEVSVASALIYLWRSNAFLFVYCYSNERFA